MERLTTCFNAHILFGMPKNLTEEDLDRRRRNGRQQRTTAPRSRCFALPLAVPVLYRGAGSSNATTSNGTRVSALLRLPRRRRARGRGLLPATAACFCGAPCARRLLARALLRRWAARPSLRSSRSLRASAVHRACNDPSACPSHLITTFCAAPHLLHSLCVRFSVRQHELPQPVAVRRSSRAVQLAERGPQLLEGRPGELP